jgi:hypothetical protein
MRTSDRRIDLLARSFEGKIGAVSEMPGCASVHSHCLSPSKFSFRDKYSPPITANSPPLEIAGVLVRFDHVARFIENANHSVVAAGPRKLSISSPVDEMSR